MAKPTLVIPPRWDDALCAFVVRDHPDFLVSVVPMLFNHRVVLTLRQDYPLTYVAGWCYSERWPAFAAAIEWNPEVERRPSGFVKEAVDLREPSDDRWPTS